MEFFSYYNFSYVVEESIFSTVQKKTRLTSETLLPAGSSEGTGLCVSGLNGLLCGVQALASASSLAGRVMPGLSKVRVPRMSQL